MPRTTAARVTKTRPATGPAKPIADTNEAPQQDRAGFNMDELVRGGSDIEVVTADKDLVRVMKEAAFFEEILKIRFHETTDENAPRLVELGVGISPMKGGKGGKDVRRAFERGKIYDVPRYIVEAAAHAKISALRQKPGPSGRPDDIVNEIKNSFSYPFEVLHDPNPKGRAWLEKVLADPA
jgi:hypothetical protein